MLRKLNTIDFQSSKYNFGRTVLIRFDFNVPIENEKILDDFRIQQSIPTIKFCLEQGAKLVLMSHLGRPNGNVDKNLSLIPVGEKLAEILEMPIKFSHDCISDDAIEVSRSLKDGEIHLLENLRFYKEEELNDPKFASKLSSHGSIYINDAFGLTHRLHASNSSIIDNFSVKGIGLLIEKELQYLSDSLKNPQKPLTLIIGGAKIGTKIDIINNFLDIADNILIGGAMANTFLFSKGKNIGKSLFEKEKVKNAREILENAKKSKTKIHLPLDSTGSMNNLINKKDFTLKTNQIEDDMVIADIGPETVELYTSIISKSKTVFWNGTMGVSEMSHFSEGNNKIIDSIVSSNSESIIGGGDTISSITNYNKSFLSEFSHISTGGGATLHLLGGNKLPAIDILDIK